MRIEQPRSSTLVASETQETARVSNQQTSRGAAPLEWFERALPAFEVGLELEATVAEELAGGRVLLQVGGALIEADSPGGLNAGQHLRLRVEQLQPHIILQIIASEPTIQAEATRLLRERLPAHADEGELLESLQRILAAELPEEPQHTPPDIDFGRLLETVERLLPRQNSPSSETIRFLLENGGLYYETKLAEALSASPEQSAALVEGDLKGLLLTVLANTPSGELARAINAQLSNLEGQQAVNLLHQLNDGAFQFQIPFYNGASFSTATLSVERDGKNSANHNGRRDGYRLLFLLDLENFGRTRIDAHLSQQTLHVIFYSDRDNSIQFIKQEIPAFRELLVSLGYREVWLAAKHIKDISDEKRQKFDALAVGAPPAIHLIDVKV